LAEVGDCYVGAAGYLEGEKRVSRYASV
jgi:hypothetical protein